MSGNFESISIRILHGIVSPTSEYDKRLGICLRRYVYVTYVLHICICYIYVYEDMICYMYGITLESKDMQITSVAYQIKNPLRRTSEHIAIIYFQTFT